MKKAKKSIFYGCTQFFKGKVWDKTFSFEKVLLAMKIMKNIEAKFAIYECCIQAYKLSKM